MFWCRQCDCNEAKHEEQIDVSATSDDVVSPQDLTGQCSSVFLYPDKRAFVFPDNLMGPCSSAQDRISARGDKTPGALQAVDCISPHELMGQCSSAQDLMGRVLRKGNQRHMEAVDFIKEQQAPALGAWEAVYLLPGRLFVHDEAPEEDCPSTPSTADDIQSQQTEISMDEEMVQAEKEHLEFYKDGTSAYAACKFSLDGSEEQQAPEEDYPLIPNLFVLAASSDSITWS